MQVCKLMQNSMTEFEVEHKKTFILASSLHSHNTKFSKKLYLITERHRTRLCLNSIRFLGPRFWLSVPEKKKKEFK